MSGVCLLNISTCIDMHIHVCKIPNLCSLVSVVTQYISTCSFRTNVDVVDVDEMLFIHESKFETCKQ